MFFVCIRPTGHQRTAGGVTNLIMVEGGKEAGIFAEMIREETEQKCCIWLCRRDESAGAKGRMW